MTFLAPGFLIAAVVGALGVIALHFVVTRRPRSSIFPTARFVPDIPVTARSRSLRFSDLLLLLVRVFAILAAGAALSRPIFPPSREHIVRVIMADVSGSAASITETRDSVRSLFRPGDAIVAFDTAAWMVTVPDSVGAKPAASAPGSISTGLVGALRAASRVRDGADSVELVVVSPVTIAEQDRATSMIRAQWPGRARFVNVSARNTPQSASVAPRTVAFLGASRPRFAVTRNRIDTVGAVIAQGHVVIAPFERRWRFVSDSLDHARVVARWIDGDPAAIEKDSASSCVRSNVVPVDSSGDLLQRPAFVSFRAVLMAPCGYSASQADTAARGMLVGTGMLARTAQFPTSMDVDSPIARWLAIIAIALAVAEMILRRSRNVGAEP